MPFSPYHKDPDACEAIEMLVRDRLLNAAHRLAFPTKQKLDCKIDHGSIRRGMKNILPEQSSRQRRLSSQQQIDNIGRSLDYRVDQAVIETRWRCRWGQRNKE